MKVYELKPCPFCGGEAEFIKGTRTIKCKSCGGAFLSTNPLVTNYEVGQAWNRRVTDGTKEAEKAE